MATAVAVIGATVALATAAFANVPITIVSQDPYTNADSYHKTEVEPDTFSFGNTIVSTFQMGRHQDGGASNIGFGTSTDGGVTWTSGGLPGLTVFSNPPGPYQRATDPAVTYDRKHNQWLIVELDSLTNNGFNGDAITVSRSTDGLTWGNPVTVATVSGFGSFDSTWINCDDWKATSPNYGRCYVEWDDFGNGAIFEMSTSTDGGLTWHAANTPSSTVIGGKPVSLPNGNVVVPIGSNPIGSALSFVSTDGGRNYSGPFSIASFQQHFIGGSLRSLNIVSADVDKAGTVYVTWYDCRFRGGCSSNDIVMSTSTDGMSWTSPVRVPIDPVNSTADHFLAGIAVQPGTGGATAGLAVVYWYYDNANCSNCQLKYGLIKSTDGGQTWGSALPLAGPFGVTWYPLTTSGYMPGDYSSASYVTSGGVTTVFAGAKSSPCQLGANNCKVAMVAPQSPQLGGVTISSKADRVATDLGRVVDQTLRSTY